MPCAYRAVSGAAAGAGAAAALVSMAPAGTAAGVEGVVGRAPGLTSGAAGIAPAGITPSSWDWYCSLPGHPSSTPPKSSGASSRDRFLMAGLLSSVWARVDASTAPRTTDASRGRARPRDRRRLGRRALDHHVVEEILLRVLRMEVPVPVPRPDGAGDAQHAAPPHPDGRDLLGVGGVARILVPPALLEGVPEEVHRRLHVLRQVGEGADRGEPAPVRPRLGHQLAQRLLHGLRLDPEGIVHDPGR